MPQADYTVSASQSGSAYASDINDALLAIQTNNSGSTAPSDLDAFMGWADTTTNFFKTRDAGNTTWYTQFPLNKNLSTYINELVLVHGLGGTAPLKSGDDLNSVDQTGFYRITTSTTNNTYGNGSVLVVNRGSGVVDQLILSITDSKLYLRNTANSGSLWTVKASISEAIFNPLTKDAIQGTTPVWASGTTLTMGTLNCMDSLRTTLITCASATLNFGTNGLNGLDAGSIASNTWYYIYAILNPTTLATGYLASTSSTSPTLPSGFTKFRLLPLAVKTKTGSAVLMRFNVTNWTSAPIVRWLDVWNTLWFVGSPIDAQSTMDNTYVVSTGLSASFIDFSLASFVPFFSRRVDVHIGLDSSDSANRFLRIRTKGVDSNTQGHPFWRAGSLTFGHYTATINTDASQVCQYRSDVNSNIGVTAYYVTEVVG
jgi:hypothetical protein